MLTAPKGNLSHASVLRRLRPRRENQREHKSPPAAGWDGWGGSERERVAWQRAEERGPILWCFCEHQSALFDRPMKSYINGRVNLRAIVVYLRVSTSRQDLRSQEARAQGQY